MQEAKAELPETRRVKLSNRIKPAQSVPGGLHMDSSRLGEGGSQGRNYRAGGLSSRSGHALQAHKQVSLKRSPPRAKTGLGEPAVAEDLTNFASEETLHIHPGHASLDEEVQSIDFDLFNAKDFL